MKRWIALLLFPFVLAGLSANPCFEEAEAVVLSVIAAKASVPELQLQGVEFEGGEDSIIPDKVIFHASDASTYLEALDARPEMTNIFQAALYSVTQRTPTMEQVKEILTEKGFTPGSVVTDGTILIQARKKPSVMEIVTSTDLSSIDLVATVDLTLTVDGKVFDMSGDVLVSGDKKRTLAVDSTTIVVNETRYKVNLKYRLKKS